MDFVGITLFLVAAITSLVLTPWIAKGATALGFLDKPETRKIHSNPIPRLGGVSVVCSICIALLAGAILFNKGHLPLTLKESIWVPLLIGSVIVFIVGVWDDISPLPVGVKFGVQSIAALLAIAWGIRFDRVSFLGETGLEIGLFAYPLTFLWIIGITNAFNLVDGLDGLSAGLASIAAGTSAAVFIMRGNPGEAMLLIITLGALVGFLRYNFYPAKIFLGDSGSLVIGYILALTAISGSQKGVTALAILFPLLVFGLPIADTVISMVRRYLGSFQVIQPYKGPIKQKLFSMRRMFEPDREHIHHRLLAVGFSHRGAVLTLYGLGLSLSVLAFLTVLANGRNAGLVLLLVALATYAGISKLGYNELRLFQAEHLLRLYEKMGLHKRFFLAFLDLLLITLSYWMAFLLKYELTWNEGILSWYQTEFPAILAIQFGFLYAFGLYNGVWRALSTGDLLRVVSAVSVGGILSIIIALIHDPPFGMFGFFAINFLVLTGVTLLSRSAYRILDYFHTGQNQSGRDALIYGAGRGGQLVLREIIQNPKLALRPLGFIDDSPNLLGRTVNRLPVLGSCEDLERILIDHPDAILVLASANIEESRREKVLRFCRLQGVPISRFEIKVTPLDPDSSESEICAASITNESVHERPHIPSEKQESKTPVYD